MSKLKELAPIKEVVKNFKTGEDYLLESVDETYKISKQDIEDITAVCNEELVYDFLFRRKLNGEKYSNEKAFSFINFAWQGWIKDEYYVFIIRNGKGNVVGAIDIKSNNLEEGEVGYWLSEKASGVMTNVILEIIKIASNSGYKKLFALTKPENDKSQSAVVRAGFVDLGIFVANNTEYFRFERQLV